MKVQRVQNELFLFYAQGSIRLNWLHSYYISSKGELTFWSSMEMEDIPILATYNTTREFVFKQKWAKGNRTDDYWSLYNVFLSKYFSAFQIHINGINKEFRVKVQCWTGCPSSSDNKGAFTYRLAAEGEDLVHLNDKERMWAAAHMHCSQSVQKMMQDDRQTLENIVKQIKVWCQQLATIFSTAGNEAFARREPVVVVTKTLITNTFYKINCQAYGHYPKNILMP
ncbi:uncharacterized protein [Pyxicephalus adspersus]|uniref:uncharacterized protein n=1 Tax=Pyxicephalus adspersus TaxID=30357 RepID=UPI003B5CB8B8